MPSEPAPKRETTRRIAWQRRLFYEMVRPPIMLFFMIFYGVRFFGRNNIPERGGLLVVANHQTYYDPPLVGAGIRCRRLNYLARKSLFRFGPLAWLIDMLDAIPLETEGGIGFEGIKESLKRLRGGEAVLIFPEGARTWDGRIDEFKPGSLTLAQRSKVPILPCAIAGCFEAWPRTRKCPRPWGAFRVVYGEPIPYETFKDLDDAELRRLVRDRVVELFESLKK